jgi:hypothetical protein
MTIILAILNILASVVIGAAGVVVFVLAVCAIYMFADRCRNHIEMTIKYALSAFIIGLFCWGIGDNLRSLFP